MPAAESLLAFFLATAVFAYMPGPSTLYAAAQTVARGRRSGWYAALGIHLGGYVHVVAAGLGVSVLFAAVPALYSTLKFIGACYLVWLGMQLFLGSDQPSNIALVAGATKHSQHTFWHSISVEILNPKTAIFYIAFLPQFTDPAAALPITAQLLILGAIVNVMFSSADVLCVLMASVVVKFFANSPAGNRILQRVGGGVLVALGLHLGFSRD